MRSQRRRARVARGRTSTAVGGEIGRSGDGPHVLLLLLLLLLLFFIIILISRCVRSRRPIWQQMRVYIYIYVILCGRTPVRARYRKTLMIYRSIVIGFGATEPHDSYYVYCRTAAHQYRLN